MSDGYDDFNKVYREFLQDLMALAKFVGTSKGFNGFNIVYRDV